MEEKFNLNYWKSRVWAFFDRNYVFIKDIEFKKFIFDEEITTGYISYQKGKFTIAMNEKTFEGTYFAKNSIKGNAYYQKIAEK